VPENLSNQHDDENAVYYLTKPKDLLHCQITQKVIKMDTVSFTSERNHVGFEYVNFHVIFSAPLVCKVNIGL
jgi:hypothetical protein